MGLDLPQRRAVAEDTIARTLDIIKEHAEEGASPESTFIPFQLDPLDPSKCPHREPSLVTVVNSDSFTAARRILADAPQAQANASGHRRIAVLNLASDVQPAGGWIHSLTKTQEEALCYSSTLYETLKKSYYPWPNVGPGSVAGVYSPGVVVFKDDLDHDCVDLPRNDRIVVGVITVAAPRWQKLTEDGERFEDPSVLEDLRGKIRLVDRMAASYGNEYLVLGAMGCGAYGCPPKLVAEEMKKALLEDEFKGWFSRVVFAVYSKVENDGNFKVFKEAFRGVRV